MRRVELLAPAGSMEALIAAVQNGCDAVYLGGRMFGARAYADNFDDAEMISAIHYAHGYGVKVYVTMNTLLIEDEMDQAIAYVKFLYLHGVDALIIQDLGLFDVVHQRFPDLELHASTQMHIHNEEGIALMREAGMKRIVLPRETTLEEIRAYAKMGIDLEVFVQGALCVSYSGQCLMSAKKLARSGNRGACAQMCRMKYRLGKTENGTFTYMEQDGVYLLSPKDLNTLRHIPELIASGIASFKIEGRMKRPAYVAVMVSLYRKAIDAYYAKQPFAANTAEAQMRKIFNRGYTSGHLFHQKGSALMNPLRPNHMGIAIGQVTGQKGNKVRMQLHAPLHQYDGIRILCEKEDFGCTVNKLYVNGLLVNEAQAGTTAEIEFASRLTKGSTVVKTSDYLQLRKIKESYAKPTRKVMIVMQVRLRQNRPVWIRVSDELGHECEVSGTYLVEKARKTPLDKVRVIKQCQKCGDSIFQVKEIRCDMEDGVTVPIKELNEVRRSVLAELYEERLKVKRQLPDCIYQRTLSLKPLHGVFVSVRTMEQYVAAKQMQAHVFAQSPLYEELHKQDKHIGYVGARVMKKPYPLARIIFSENSGMIQPHAIAEHFVNITNSYAAAFLFAHGVEGIILSNECTAVQKEQIKTAFELRYGTKGSFIDYGYGREELMIMEYCPINACVLDNDKQHCRLCKGSVEYVLEDLHHHRYPLYGDEDCRMHIMDDQVLEHMQPASAIYICFHDEKSDAVTTRIQRAQSFLLQKDE